MRLFFDMDNVLADFEKDAKKHKVPGIELNKGDSLLSPDVLDEKKRFWQRIEKNQNFWLQLPMVTDIKLLLDYAIKMGDMYVLSKAPAASNFVGGKTYYNKIIKDKKTWINQNMSKYFPKSRVIVSDVPKGKLIGPGATDVLIDDRLDNVNEWQQAGGAGIHFKDVAGAIQYLAKLR
ncbi:MAG: hypothetical protein LBF37_03655 [Rickettsiales bacterium]|jgi:hypothetical protein|nr:hypothetical protein [Rickettsiales bacterium]